MKTTSVYASILIWILPIAALAQSGAPVFDRANEQSPAADRDQLELVEPLNPTQEQPLPGSLTVGKPQARYLGSLECSNCHVAPQAKNRLDGITDFVALNEYQIWLNRDPHSRAYLSIIPDQDHFNAVRERLTELNSAVNKAASPGPDELDPVREPKWGASNDLSRDILRRMFADKYEDQVQTLFGELSNVQNAHGKRLEPEHIALFVPKLKSTMQQCLSCHAGWDKRQSEFDFETVKYGTGVSCEACHGASEKWLKLHFEPEWRKLDPRIKESSHGQFDVRNPIERATLCYSCHVGDVEQGKIITHEMYAAGHPPLPSIEIESFADQIPRHWRYLSEKSDFKFAREYSEFKQFYGFNLSTKKDIPWTDEEFPKTKNLLVGGVMASAQSIRLLAECASSHAASNHVVDGAPSDSIRNSVAWPEFAAFDCAACHHDLKVQGFARGFAGVPGRPPAPYWPRVVTNLGVGYASLEQQNFQVEFDKRQSAFQAVLDRQPFGAPAELSQTGTSYADWLTTEVANYIATHPLTRKDAVSVLELLCGANENSVFQPQAETWDFHSARQLIWAINQVHSEISKQPPPNESIATNKFRVANPGSEFGKILMELESDLILSLPITGAITDQQTRFLSAWQNFDRNLFFEKLTSLRAALVNDPMHNLAPAPVIDPGAGN